MYVRHLFLASLCCILLSSFVSAQSWTSVPMMNSNMETGDILTGCFDSENNLYIGGNFYDSTGRTYVAKWNGAQWENVGGEGSLRLTNPNISFGDVLSICIDSNDQLYVLGSNSMILVWNGTNWTELDTPNMTILNMHLSSANELYISGYVFEAARLYKLVGSSWIDIRNGNPDFQTGLISDLKTDGIGNLYVAGLDAGILKWDGINWLRLVGSDGASLYSRFIVVNCTSMDVSEEGIVYVIGDDEVYKWDGLEWLYLGVPDGSATYSLSGSGIMVNGSGRPMVNIYYFNQFGTMVGHLFEWDGSAWRTLQNDQEGSLYARLMEPLEDAANRVYSLGRNMSLGRNLIAWLDRCSIDGIGTPIISDALVAENISNVESEATIFIPDSITSVQWQAFFDKKFNNLTDTFYFSGSESDTLRLRRLNSSFDGLKFRCLMSTESCFGISDTGFLNIDSECSLAVVSDPSDTVVDKDSVAIFSVQSSDTLTSYRWQWRRNGVYEDIDNSSVFIGVNEDTLRVTVSDTLNNSYYRCILNRGSCMDTSSEAHVVLNAASMLHHWRRIELPRNYSYTTSVSIACNPSGALLLSGVKDEAGHSCVLSWDGYTWSQLGSMMDNIPLTPYGHITTDALGNPFIGCFDFVEGGQGGEPLGVMLIQDNHWIDIDAAPGSPGQLQIPFSDPNGKLYAFDADVFYRWDDSLWTKMNGILTGVAQALFFDNNGRIFSDRVLDGPPGIFEWVNNSWVFRVDYTMYSFGGSLVGVDQNGWFLVEGSMSGNPQTGNFIWKTDGVSWVQIGDRNVENTVGSNWFTLDSHDKIYVIDDFLGDAGMATVYQWSGSEWSSLAGEGSVAMPFSVRSIKCDPSDNLFALVTSPDLHIEEYVNCPLSIIEQPQNQVRALQDDVIFSAVASNVEAEYQWQKFEDGHFIDMQDGGQISGATTPNLHIADLTLNEWDKSYFRCEVRHAEFFVRSEVVQLRVQCLLEILQEPSDLSVNVGEDVSLVLTTNDATSAFQWQRRIGNQFVNVVDEGRFLGAMNDTLRILFSEFSMDSSEFRCLVSVGECMDTTRVVSIFINNTQIWEDTGPHVSYTGEAVKSISTDEYGNIYVFRSNSSIYWNGTTWQLMPDMNGANANGMVTTSCVDANGILYAAGTVVPQGSTGVYSIFKWNGTSWSDALSSGGYNSVPYYNMFCDGVDIYVATASGMIRKIIGNSLSTIVSNGQTSFDTNVDLLKYGEVFYVNGSFTNGAGHSYIAQWDGIEWGEVGGFDALAPNNSILDFCLDYRGYLYVAGSFTNSSGKKYVAVWNGTSWSELGGLNGLSANGQIKVLATDQMGNIYAAGDFTNEQGNRYVAVWNGIQWSELGGENSLRANGLISCLHVDHVGTIYAAGSFSLVNGLYGAHIQGCNVPISLQPQSVTAFEGDSVELVVGCEMQDVSFRWQVETDGAYQPLVDSYRYSGVNSDTLRIHGVSQMDPLTFRCSIFSESCIVHTRAANVSVSCPFDIVEHPVSNLSLDLGTSAILTVTGSQPDLQFQWQMDSGNGFEDLIDDDHFDGVTNDTLELIDAVLNWQSSKIRCIVNHFDCYDTSDVSVLQIVVSMTLDGLCVDAPENTEIKVLVQDSSNNSEYEYHFNTASDGSFYGSVPNVPFLNASVKSSVIDCGGNMRSTMPLLFQASASQTPLTPSLEWCDTLNLYACFSIASDTSIQQPYYVFLNQCSVGADSAHWSFGDGTYSSEVYPTHTYQDFGNYELCLTVFDELGNSSTFCDSLILNSDGSFGGGVVSAFTLIVVTTDIDEVQNDAYVLYPNPTNKEAYLTVGHSSSVSVLDVSGREIWHCTSVNSGFVVLPTNGWASGQYFVRVIEGAASTHTYKLFVNR